MNNFEFVNCPACSSDEKKFLYHLSYLGKVPFSTVNVNIENKPEMWKCSECGTKYVQKTINPIDAESLYTNGKSDDRWMSESFLECKTREILNVVDTYCISNRKVLDIGCNTGEFLDYVKERGCKTYGVELSETAQEVLKNKGHSVKASINEFDTDFDVIVAFDLIEHLYDIRSFLKNCYDRLNKNGFLILLSGNANCIGEKVYKSKWWYSNFPEHIVFISKKYLAQNEFFSLESYRKTFNSIFYENSKIKKIYYLIRTYLLQKESAGTISIFKDHYICVLRKRSI